MSEENLSWCITNRYSNKEEAEESMREHWRGYYAEYGTLAGMLISAAGLAGTLVVKTFAPEIEAVPEILGSGSAGLFLLSFFGYCFQGLTINNGNNHPNSYSSSDFYHAAKKFLRTGKNHW
ncbi:hypothetical protein HYT25_01180 [Candidatus Pacearchaeota archaeon]|nr:hypothetical protein [Candidatus Pacearchaeota archaeon]